MLSVGEWLETFGMSQYENNFIANGFDNIDFLVSKGDNPCSGVRNTI